MNTIYLGLGMLYAKYVGVERMTSKWNWVEWFLFVSLFAAFIYFFTMGNNSRLSGLVLALTGSGAVIAISMLFDHRPPENFIQQIGKASLPIYLAHVISGSGIRIIFQKGLGLESVPMHLIAGVILGTAIPFLIYKSANYMNVPFLFSFKSRS
jgi:peptidoglycan/LPS O-acetylase OafA/YrhL